MTDPERAMRFGYLLSEIELAARRLLDGIEPDIVLALMFIRRDVDEASGIAAQNSREALDKVVKEQ